MCKFNSPSQKMFVCKIEHRFDHWCFVLCPKVLFGVKILMFVRNTFSDFGSRIQFLREIEQQWSIWMTDC